jgi:hypothetical protein
VKITTCLISLCLLGGLSSSVFAADWEALINRNEDRAAGLQLGVTNHVSGVTGLKLAYDSKRANYADNSENNKGKLLFSLPESELYFDSQLNAWSRAHIAVADYYDFTAATFNKSNFAMFFSEANVSMNNLAQNGHLWAKIGRQFLNFGASHSKLVTHPLTRYFYETNAPAVTVGLANINGFYGDVFAYQGGAYGITTNQQQDHTYNPNGYGLDLAYANGDNQQGYNLVVDYLADMSTTLTGRWNLTTLNITPTKQIPGVAIDAYYHTGAWGFDANYVAAIVGYDTTQLSYNGTGAKPGAYGVEGSYTFAGQHPQILALGYQGTQDALNMTVWSSGYPVPQSRINLSYTYTLSSNLLLQTEYRHDVDYSTNDRITVKSGTTTHGTGNADNGLLAQLKVIF